MAFPRVFPPRVPSPPPPVVKPALPHELYQCVSCEVGWSGPDRICWACGVER